MPNPLLIVAGIDAVVTVGHWAWNAYRNYQINLENDRYWDDYEKNTGITPLYPYRAGSSTDWAGMAFNQTRAVMNLYKNR